MVCKNECSCSFLRSSGPNGTRVCWNLGQVLRYERKKRITQQTCSESYIISNWDRSQLDVSNSKLVSARMGRGWGQKNNLCEAGCTGSRASCYNWWGLRCNAPRSVWCKKDSTWKTRKNSKQARDYFLISHFNLNIGFIDASRDSEMPSFALAHTI